MAQRTQSQTNAIKKHLEDGKTITPIEALNLYGCFRLSAIIFKLRESGLDIETLEDKNRYATYKLNTEAVA